MQDNTLEDRLQYSKEKVARIEGKSPPSATAIAASPRRQVARNNRILKHGWIHPSSRGSLKIAKKFQAALKAQFP